MHVLLTGGNGLLGRSLQRLQPRLKPEWQVFAPSSADFDLRNQAAARHLFASKRFDLVIHAAAVVGGIKANIAEPVSFLADNLLINTLTIEAARAARVPRFIFLGSSCMYPKDVMRPLRECDMLAAPLEPTNEGYAISKIAGAKHCDAISRQTGLAYRTIIPCNLYGPEDHFGSERSHLVAAALSKVHDAHKRGMDEVTIWGDGTALREFLYVDDLTEFILTHADTLARWPTMLNVGAVADHTVDHYYRVAAEVVGYRGRFKHDLSAPVGMVKKLMDCSLARSLGWQLRTPLQAGMASAYRGLLAQDGAAS